MDTLTTATVLRKVVGLRRDSCGRGGGNCDVSPVYAPNWVRGLRLTDGVAGVDPVTSSPFTVYTAEASISDRLKRPEVSCGNTATLSNSLTRYTVLDCRWNTGDIFLACIIITL